MAKKRRSFKKKNKIKDRHEILLGLHFSMLVKTKVASADGWPSSFIIKSLANCRCSLRFL